LAERIIRTGSRIKLATLTRLSRATVALALAGTILSCGSEDQAAQKTSAVMDQGTVIRELNMMMDQKQQAREALDSLVAEFGWRSPEAQEASRHEKEIDSASVVRLEQIIAQFGWPGKSVVGDQAALAAFLVLQYADVATQEKYLPLVKAAADKGDVEPMHLAMLQDRVLMRQGKPQIYGTQLWNDPSTGELGLYQIEDSAGVDLRREEVGLGPLDEYLRSMGLDPDTLKPQTPGLEVIVR